MATRINSNLGNQSWEVVTDDFSKLYTWDNRWCEGRFAIWSLEINTDKGLVKKCSGYFDNTTGLSYYNKRSIIP